MTSGNKPSEPSKKPFVSSQKEPRPEQEPVDFPHLSVVNQYAANKDNACYRGGGRSHHEHGE